MRIMGLMGISVATAACLTPQDAMEQCRDHRDCDQVHKRCNGAAHRCEYDHVVLDRAGSNTDRTFDLFGPEVAPEDSSTGSGLSSRVAYLKGSEVWSVAVAHWALCGSQDAVIRSTFPPECLGMGEHWARWDPKREGDATGDLAWSMSGAVTRGFQGKTVQSVCESINATRTPIQDCGLFPMGTLAQWHWVHKAGTSKAEGLLLLTENPRALLFSSGAWWGDLPEFQPVPVVLPPEDILDVAADGAGVYFLVHRPGMPGQPKVPWLLFHRRQGELKPQDWTQQSLLEPPLRLDAPGRWVPRLPHVANPEQGGNITSISLGDTRVYFSDGHSIRSVLKNW